MLKKSDIIDRLAGRGYTKKAADVLIDDVFAVIKEAMAQGENVQLHGFGTFTVNEVGDRESVDVKSGERIVIPGHKNAKFSPSISLKRIVREGIVRE